MIEVSNIDAHRDAVSASFGVFRRTPREMLRWVTVIIHAVLIEVDDDVGPQLREAADRYHAERRAVFMQSGRISRSLRGRSRWAGVLEIDLLHPWFVCSAMKAELLSGFGIDATALQPDQRILILHEHAVVDCRGHASAEALMRDLRAAYPGPRRVHGARLYDEGTVAQNLSNLAGYAGKFVHRYSAAWNGRKTTYAANYEPEWRDRVLSAYEAIGYDRLLNTNVITQAASSGESREMYAVEADSPGEMAEIEPLQLTPSEAPTTNRKDYHTKPSHHDYETDRSSGDDEDMRAHEIIDDYIDPEKIEPEFRREIEDAINRQGPMMNPELMQAMYGDPPADLEIEQQRADLLKTQAEIARLRAAAARDRAEARVQPQQPADSPRSRAS